MGTDQNRRKTIKQLLAGSALLATSVPSFALEAEKKSSPMALKGNINHSVCRWCYNDIPLDQLCVIVKEMGLVGIDLVGPKEWDILKKHNLISTMCNGAEIGLVKGWNDTQYHDVLIKNYT